MDIVMNTKESKGAIVAIRFSHRGDFLAVSYDNEIIQPDKDEQPEKVENSFVLVYVNKAS